MKNNSSKTFQSYKDEILNPDLVKNITMIILNFFYLKLARYR
jgi:hypothetical protein